MLYNEGAKMPYIPEAHKKYNLLPNCQKNNGEVFVYPSELLKKLQNINSKILDPYGYSSYDEYYDKLNKIYSLSHDDKFRTLILRYKKRLVELNDKHYWSVLKYIGKSTDTLLGLTNGIYYYWPATKDNAKYSGVIDDEEYTSYLYSTDPQLWEIAEDPTKMAYNTLYNNQNGISQNDYNHIMEQVKDMFEYPGKE